MLKILKHVLEQQANPEVLNPAVAAGQATVSPIQAVTAPMPNTKMAEAKYYYCTMPTASLHRADGKKLPFVQGFLKTNIKEDIAYLEQEIEVHQNPYLRRATPDEIAHAQLREDPLGTVREAVKKELSIEELEKLLADRRAVAAAGSSAGDDASKIGGVDKKQASDVIRAAGVVTHASATGTTAQGLNLAGLLKK